MYIANPKASTKNNQKRYREEAKEGVANVCQNQGILLPGNQEVISQNYKGKMFFPHVNPALETFF